MTVLFFSGLLLAFIRSLNVTTGGNCHYIRNTEQTLLQNKKKLHFDVSTLQTITRNLIVFIINANKHKILKLLNIILKSKENY